MSIFDRLPGNRWTTREQSSGNVLNKEAGGMVQFNLWVRKSIKSMAQMLAAEYGVPIGALTGHALEVGMLCLILARDDPEEVERLKRHLAQRHVLGKKDGASMLDHMVVSAPTVARLLKADMTDLERAVKCLDFLAFDEKRVSEKQWRKLSVMARLDVRTRMARLMVKLDELGTTDLSSAAEGIQHATPAEEDFTEEYFT